MAILNKFCFSCSVRLGSIIISVLTLIQVTGFLVVTLLWAESLTVVSETLHDWIDLLKLKDEFYQEIANNPKILIIVLSVFFTSLICSCILFLYGCLQCKVNYMYPFVVLYLIYIFGLVVALLLLILFVKVSGNGLGDLILYSNLGGFVMLYFFYTWTCTLSLTQIIKELQQRLKQKLKAAERTKKVRQVNKDKVNKNKKTKGFYNYAHFT